MHRILLFVAVTFFLSHTLPSPAAPPDGDDLVGTWVANPVVNGQTGVVVIHLTANDEGGLTVTLDMPPIDAWGLPIGTATRVDEGLQFGSRVFAYDAATGTLTMPLSSAMVPIYTVEAQFRRSDDPPEPQPPPDYGKNIEPAWSVDLGAPVWASPATAGDTLFVGGDDHRLHALATGTGDARWVFETGGIIRAKPLIDRDRIIFQSDDGLLYALDAGDGTELWRTRLSEGPAARSAPGTEEFRYDHYAASLSVGEKYFYTATLAGDVVALDRGTGEIVWKTALGDGVQGTPAPAADLLIAGSFDNHVYGLDAGSGRIRWKKDTGAPVVSAPAIAGDIAIIGTRGYDIFGLDPNSGDVRWRYYYWFSWVESSATVFGGTAYVGSSDARVLTALDARSGEPRWVFRTAGSAWATPAVDEAAVYIGSVGVRGYISAHQPGFFAVDRATGKALWSYFPETDENSAMTGFASSPTLDEQRVYVGGLDGRVYAFPR